MDIAGVAGEYTCVWSNYAVNCWCCVASVVDEWIIEPWFNDADWKTDEFEYQPP
jgi:hypothetical protein